MPVTETWVPFDRWTHQTGEGSLSQVTSTPLPAYSLRAPTGVLALRIGSRSVYWNGMEVRLGYAPQLIDGHPCIHSLDLKKTIQPTLAGRRSPFSTTNLTIVIDPGHGGADAGTRSISDGHYEKEFTLDWARRLQALLSAKGWQAWLTRSNDSDLVVTNRVVFAEAHKAALFVSLHFNSAAPNQLEAGLETYCLTPTGLPSNLTREFADDLALIFPNNAFDEANFLLALQVHRALLQVNGNRDRGVRRARFPGVLRGQRRPAVLIEGGYLSNPQEASLIANPAYRQQMAEAVARAINELYLPAHPKPNMPAQETFSSSHAPEIGGSVPGPQLGESETNPSH